MLVDCNSVTLKLIHDSIKAGEAISFPTDTVYALACDASNSKAIKKLFAIKKRPIEKTAPILIKNFATLKHFADTAGIVDRLAQSFWPGKLTIVLPTGLNIPLSEHCIRRDGSNSTVGFRVPNHLIALEILDFCNLPLLATSVNIAGENSLNCAKDITHQFGHQIAYIVKDTALSDGIASTIVEINGGEVKILREGAIPKDAIDKIIV